MIRTKEPFEYFCFHCGQLRLCLDGKAVCKCGNYDIAIGKPGELPKEELKRKYNKRR